MAAFVTNGPEVMVLIFAVGVGAAMADMIGADAILEKPVAPGVLLKVVAIWSAVSVPAEELGG